MVPGSEHDQLFWTRSANLAPETRKSSNSIPGHTKSTPLVINFSSMLPLFQTIRQVEKGGGRKGKRERKGKTKRGASEGRQERKDEMKRKRWEKEIKRK